MKLKETETIEFKKSTAELNDALKSISAILNKHQKGELFFGLKNDGSPVKNSVSEKTLRDISQSISTKIEPKIYPTIVTTTIDEVDIIRVSFEGSHIPYSAEGRYFIRVADEDRQLSAAELKKLIIRNKNYRWDSAVNHTASSKEIDIKKVKEFCRLAGITFTNVRDVLESLNLYVDETLTNAAVILFAKNPYKYFFNARLMCAVFASDNTASILDQKEFHGDLFTLIREAELYILKNIHIGMEVEGLYRNDVPEINQEAIREAIINAFIHRDYTELDFVSLNVFKNRVEIRSPGGLFGGLQIRDIVKRHISKRRNELIADLLSRAHYVERKGRGISLILGKEPKTKFEEIADLFITTFQRKPDLIPQPKRGINEGVNEGISEGIKSILDFIKGNPGINAVKLSEETNIPLKTLERWVRSLKKKQAIEFRGSRKTGGYFVK